MSKWHTQTHTYEHKYAIYETDRSIHFAFRCVCFTFSSYDFVYKFSWNQFNQLILLIDHTRHEIIIIDYGTDTTNVRNSQEAMPIVSSGISATHTICVQILLLLSSNYHIVQCTYTQFIIRILLKLNSLQMNLQNTIGYSITQNPTTHTQTENDFAFKVFFKNNNYIYNFSLIYNQYKCKMIFYLNLDK